MVYYAKTGGKSPEQAYEHVKNYFDTKPENEIQDLVSTVFDSKNYNPTIKAKDDEEFTLFEELIEWLKINYYLKRNEITKFIENDGRELEEKHFNSIFIAAKKYFQNLLTIMYSVLLILRISMTIIQ